MMVSGEPGVDCPTADNQRPVLVLTRPTARVGSTLKTMNEIGVVCLHLPVIDLVPLDRLDPIDPATVDLIVFVSPAAVEHGVSTPCAGSVEAEHAMFERVNVRSCSA